MSSPSSYHANRNAFPDRQDCIGSASACGAGSEGQGSSGWLPGDVSGARRHAGQPRQAGLVEIPLVVDVKQERQLEFLAGGVNRHVPRIVEREAILVLAKAFRAGIHILLQHGDQSLVHPRLNGFLFLSRRNAGVAGSRVDRAEGNQPIAIGGGLLEDEVRC